jgi:hypothetical protein
MAKVSERAELRSLAGYRDGEMVLKKTPEVNHTEKMAWRSSSNFLLLFFSILLVTRFFVKLSLALKSCGHHLPTKDQSSPEIIPSLIYEAVI